MGTTVGFKPSEFKPPVEQCHFDDGGEVMSTPVVMDADGDGKPEIFFPSFVFGPGASSSSTRIHAISGTDCAEIWNVPGEGVAGVSDLAAADLDGDGVSELVGAKSKGLVVFDARTGAVRDSIDVPALIGIEGIAVAIANIDGAGPPEIVAGSLVARFEAGKLKPLWAGEPGYWNASVIADLDADGVMEVISLTAVHDGLTGAVKLDLGREGFAAIADFDPASPGPEIIRTQWKYKESAVVVLAGLGAPTPGKVLFGPYVLGGADKSARDGGAPVVADFDGDGEVDVGVADATQYTTFARRCAATPLPADCAGAGVLWRRNSRDASSGITTSTVFDFNCDGKAEVVYRDECFLRVYEGASGNVVFASTMTSNTAIEGAVVADTDGTGHAKIVIGTNKVKSGLAPCGVPDEYTGTLFAGDTTGVYVLRDPDNRWQATRRIWNQNSYHVTNIKDDGSIPLHEAPSWSGLNTYRANLDLH